MGHARSELRKRMDITFEEFFINIDLPARFD